MLIFIFSFRSFHCIPKHEKHYQLSSSLTIDKEQQLSEHDEISSPTKQLRFMNENQNLNSPKITSPSQTRYIHHQNAEKKLLISKLEAENRY